MRAVQSARRAIKVFFSGGSGRDDVTCFSTRGLISYQVRTYRECLSGFAARGYHDHTAQTYTR